MSSVVTEREFGAVLIRLVADLAIFLRSRVVNVMRDGLMLSAMSNARVCVPPGVCTLQGSGAGGS
jgi:hypothetical protein